MLRRWISRVRLIVNADDFGLTGGVNRAISELAAAGALGSATLMAGGAAFQDAVEAARRVRSWRSGATSCWSTDMPAPRQRRCPRLQAATAALRTPWCGLSRTCSAAGLQNPRLKRKPWRRSRRLQAAGVTVSHVDTHKHTHLFPRVARPLLRAAMRCGVRAIRNPFEQAWSASLTRGALLRKLEVTALRSFQQRFDQLRRASGLASTDGSIGVSATGRWMSDTLRRLLDAAPAGTWELVCHPGYNDADLDAVQTRLRGTRDVEREALLSLIPEAVRAGRVRADLLQRSVRLSRHAALRPARAKCDARMAAQSSAPDRKCFATLSR